MEIRPAKREDVKVILNLIHELAAYEKEPNAVDNSLDNLEVDLFDDQVCESLVAEVDHKVVGFALFYTSYSTWKGRCLYLEDLFVLEDYRRYGIGGKLFDRLVAIAKERGYARMDWQVLNWNEPAIQFYKKKNAHLDDEWLNGRLFFK